LETEIAYLYNDALREAANRRGENYWYCYVQEVFEELGVRAEPVPFDAVAAGTDVLSRCRVLIVGDYTATVGDPSGQSKTRPVLKHEEVMEHGGALIEDLPNSGYTTLTALIIAKAAFQQNDTGKAKAYLQSAIEHGESEAIQRIARLRLARILMLERKWNDAIGLLDGNAGEFAGLYEEMRGDIFLAQGDLEEAHVAYERSLAGGNTRPNNGRFQIRVRTKLDDLGSVDRRQQTRETE